MQIEGVGRVDMVVDGWIVVECDSREFHGGWEQQHKDRMRDLALAARGYVTVRPTAQQLYTAPHRLIDAIRGLRGATFRAPGPSARAIAPARARYMTTPKLVS